MSSQTDPLSMEERSGWARAARSVSSRRPFTWSGTSSIVQRCTRVPMRVSLKYEVTGGEGEEVRNAWVQSYVTKNAMPSAPLIFG